MKYNYKKLGQIIKDNREAIGYSRRNLAARVDTSDTELKRIEEGERITPNLITLIKLCEELDLNLQFLLEDCDFLEEKNKKIYWVVVKYSDINLFQIEATTPEEAVRFILNFICCNEIIDVDGSRDNVEFYATDSKREIDKLIADSGLTLIDYSNYDGTFDCPYCGATIEEDDLD